MSKHYRLGAGPLLCCRPAQPSASLMFPVGLLFPPTKHSSRVPHLNKQHLCPPSGSCQEPSWEQFLTPSLTSSEPVTKSCRQSCQFYLRNISSVHSTVSPRPTALSRSPLLRSHIYGHLYSSRKSAASLAFPPPTHVLAPFIPSSSTNVRSDHRITMVIIQWLEHHCTPTWARVRPCHVYTYIHIHKIHSLLGTS